MQFTETEQAILRLVQRDLPQSLTPYAAIAAATDSTEEEVLSLLRRLKDAGAIRRFGASIKHQKAGFSYNAMVAWVVAPEHMEAAGVAAAANPHVSHCYYRPTTVPDWPYTLFTMIHGLTETACSAAVAELAALPHMGDHAVLTSRAELKKISMTYF